MNTEAKITSYTTITLIILRETRLERGIHQAQLAERCDRTPSAWAKVEMGKTVMSMELFYRACSALSIQPSAVMAAAERYATLFSQREWIVLARQLENEDELLKEMQEYYSSPGFKNMPSSANGFQVVTALNTPIYNYDGSINIINAFRYVLDKTFKEECNNYHPLSF